MSQASVRIVVVPRWGGTSSDDWYPWAVKRLQDTDGLELHVLDLPDPATPTLQSWVSPIRRVLGEDRRILSRTLLVGHSVGCQAALRALIDLPTGSRLGGLLCVAGWWSVDQPWDSLRPWMQTPPHLDRVRDVVGTTRVLLSTNDPFTADHEANAALWRERLGAEVVTVEAARHFNAAEEPAVLEQIQQLIADL